jgi:energy-converting hydrogenase A subunit R
MKRKQVCAWDLEGPITTLDFAAELSKSLGRSKLLGLSGKKMGALFAMISDYDDYLVEDKIIKSSLGISNYQPGDTLRLMAPIYALNFTDSDLKRLAESNLGLLPGCRDLFEFLSKDWKIYVISTSYEQFAFNVTNYLKIPPDQVYCTAFEIDKMQIETKEVREELTILVNDILNKFLENENNLQTVIEDLHHFFWKGNNSGYIKAMKRIEVRGGERKESAIEEISQKEEVSLSEMIAIGDSITDINMLERIKKENGISISFNGNRFSIKKANIAITATSNLGILPIFDNHASIDHFLDEWRNKSIQFKGNPRNIPKKLIGQRTREFLIKYNIIPEIDDLNNENTILDQVIEKQERTRKLVRGWVGEIG